MEEKFEGKKSRSTTVKITKGQDEALDQFLKTDRARLMGFRYKSDIVNQAIRDFLLKIGHFRESEESD